MSVLKRIGVVVACIVAVLVVAVCGLLGWLTASEYQPEPTETLLPEGRATGQVRVGDAFSLLTWNIGYGALGDNADFFMDGGTMVLTADEARVRQNMADVVAEVSALSSDVAFFQEVDLDSDRSAHIDERSVLDGVFADDESYFALNYQTPFVPIGWPPYGKISGGLLTLSRFEAQDATRESLPLSYTWPMSTVQLKRCQLVVRVPVEGSAHELVLVNEHPDAYTDEEHHAMQVEAIRDFLAAEAAAGNYVVAGGDWNHTFSSVDQSAYPLLPESNWEPGALDVATFGEGWRFVMDASAPTCRLLDAPLVDRATPQQYYMIDGFIVSGNVQVDSVQTQDLGFVASDHNPMLARFTLSV